MENDEKLLLTEKEAALLLSMSVHFLRRDRISSNGVGVPFIRIGGAVRYHRSALEAWIAQKTVTPPVQVSLPPPEVTTERRRRGRPTKANQIRDRQ
jgi:predicted DNA-binding transcriptional regulator AlpA